MTDKKKKNLCMYGHKHVYKYTEKSPARIYITINNNYLQENSAFNLFSPTSLFRVACITSVTSKIKIEISILKSL